MIAIILGGAPGNNWIPLLLPLVGVLLLAITIEYIVKFIRKKLHH
jgi:hypothetical protein